MDSIKSLTGPELYELYLRDKSNDHLKQPENLKTLLTYLLNEDMRELTDSDWEMIDFCSNAVSPSGFPDEQKLRFLRDKYALIRKERAKMQRIRGLSKMAAGIAIVIFCGIGALMLGGTESEAGVFDWVRSLFVEEDGEQLVIQTHDATLKGIEMKEGHLPDRLPDEYYFIKSQHDSSSASSMYQYIFQNISSDKLYISITEYHNINNLYQYESEIKRSSSKTIQKNDIDYYYNENHNKNRISWISDTSVYSISGSFTLSELEKILSYYN